MNFGSKHGQGVGGKLHFIWFSSCNWKKTFFDSIHYGYKLDLLLILLRGLFTIKRNIYCRCFCCINIWLRECKNDGESSIYTQFDWIVSVYIWFSFSSFWLHNIHRHGHGSQYLLMGCFNVLLSVCVFILEIFLFI